MRKFKSKKAMTLVELLVTVAILGIVSGFSITIVVTAMNNYTEAAIMQKEQDTALMLEDYIVRNARVSRKVQFIENNPASVAKVNVPSKTYKGFYMAKINNVIETFDYAEIDPATGNFNYALDNPSQYTRFTYENVRKITFAFSRQKRFTDDIESQCTYCMDYSIEMMSGYILKGQVIMNNADAEYMGKLSGDSTGKGKTTGFVDPLAEYKLIEVTDGGTQYVFDPSYDVAVVFVFK